VIRDKRRIDPTGGGAHRAGDTAKPASARPGDPASASGGGTPGAGPEQPATTRPDHAAAGASGGTEGTATPTGAPESSGTPEPDRTPEAGTGPPESGQPAAPGPQDEPAGGLGAELEALRAALDERTQDLQRITAEYANYRKRVERDRALIGEQAIGNVLSELLPVLDDLDRAREHGELVDGFAAVAEQLLAALTKFGLTAFGEKGDPFDPTRHEAVAHLTSDEVEGPTCVDILRRGYLLGDRLLRPAMVAVAEPPSGES